MAEYGAKLAAKNVLNCDGLRYDNRAMPAIGLTCTGSLRVLLIRDTCWVYRTLAR